jgi:hypothetical protein
VRDAPQAVLMSKGDLEFDVVGGRLHVLDEDKGYV